MFGGSYYELNTYYLRTSHLTYFISPNPQDNALISCPHFTEKGSEENRRREAKKLVPGF